MRIIITTPTEVFKFYHWVRDFGLIATVCCEDEFYQAFNTLSADFICYWDVHDPGNTLFVYTRTNESAVLAKLVMDLKEISHNTYISNISQS